MAILRGKKTSGWLTQEWAIARALENLDYYSAVKLVGLKTLSDSWDNVKEKIYNKSIRRGYEFVLRRKTVPSAR